MKLGLRYSLAATTILSLVAPPPITAWSTGSSGRTTTTIPTTRGRTTTARVRRMPAAFPLEASRTPETDALPQFSSLFNRTGESRMDSGIDQTNDNDDGGAAYSVQQRAFRFGNQNKDRNIDNFDQGGTETADAAETDGTSVPAVALAGLAAATGLLVLVSQGADPTDPSSVLATGSALAAAAGETLSDPSAALDRVVELTESMGPLGVAYFGVAYCIAEILAIPAIPLTASAGYLFGPVQGTAVVLLSASVAAGVSFWIGRTFLREYVEGLLEENPRFGKLDKAIGREGFKLMLLLRLSPIFPFALSNYLYGATSINFSAFFGGTLLGFAPGTIAYVYTGYVGKALTGDAGGDAYPWYVYGGGLALFAAFLKVVADEATRVVREIEAEEDEALAALEATKR